MLSIKTVTYFTAEHKEKEHLHIGMYGKCVNVKYGNKNTTFTYRKGTSIREQNITFLPGQQFWIPVSQVRHFQSGEVTAVCAKQSVLRFSRVIGTQIKRNLRDVITIIFEGLSFPHKDYTQLDGYYHDECYDDKCAPLFHSKLNLIC